MAMVFQFCMQHRQRKQKTFLTVLFHQKKKPKLLKKHQRQKKKQKALKNLQRFLGIGIIERSRQSGSQYSKDFTKYICDIIPTKEETGNYMQKVTALFQKLQQTNANYKDIWEQLKDVHINYLTKNSTRQEFKNNEWNRAKSTFDCMKDYWSKVLEYYDISNMHIYFAKCKTKTIKNKY